MNKQDNYGLQSSCHWSGTAEEKETRYYHSKHSAKEFGNINVSWSRCVWKGTSVEKSTHYDQTSLFCVFPPLWKSLHVNVVSKNLKQTVEIFTQCKEWLCIWANWIWNWLIFVHEMRLKYMSAKLEDKIKANIDAMKLKHSVRQVDEKTT